MISQMRLTKLQKNLAILSLLAFTLLFGASQLSSMSLDASLSEWQQGAEGFNKSSQLQVASKKPVALFFYTDWCDSCEKLRNEVLATPQLKEFMTTMHPVQVNPERGAAENRLAKAFGVMGYPSFFVVDTESGQARVIRRTSHITPEQFITQLEQASMSLASERNSL